MTWGYVAVGAATLVGGAMASSATKKAAKGQAAASQSAIGEQQRQFDVSNENTRPYREAGATSLEELQRLIGVGRGVDTGERTRQRVTADNFDAAGYLEANPDVAADPFFAANPYEHFVRYGAAENRQAMVPVYSRDAATGFGQLQGGPAQSEVQMDPGYQFGLTEGQKAIDRKVAASGGRISGAAMKAAGQYGTDYATTKYDAAYNRANQARSDRLNRLAALAGIGQTATGQSAQAGSNTANAIGNLATNQANASGAAGIAQANIWGGAGNQLAALYGRQAAGSNDASYRNDLNTAAGQYGWD